MRRIVLPFRALNKNRCVVALVIAALVGATAIASTDPTYWGTLRVQMRERILTIDPRQWPLPSLQEVAAAQI